MTGKRFLFSAITFALILTACGSAAAERSPVNDGAEAPSAPVATLAARPRPTATPPPIPVPASTLEILAATPPATCPVTRPEANTFVPPEPYPATPPRLYDAVWYGAEALWTMVNPEGEIWQSLPYHDDVGGEPVFVQKTFWWRAGYSATEEQRPDITVTGKGLDQPGPTFEAGGPGTNGMRTDIGSFMLVGIGLPTPGCWEITGHYGDAELTYIVWVTTST